MQATLEKKTSLENTTATLERLEPDINRIAARFACDRSTRADLRQEMLCHLLTLPPGKTRKFYLSSVGMHAFNYWARSVVDAPLDRGGRPILLRETRSVGGLAELDRICRNQAA